MRSLRTFLLLFFPLVLVSSQAIVKTLPGYDGDLPFALETGDVFVFRLNLGGTSELLPVVGSLQIWLGRNGYVGVGDLDEVQLFYHFIESERSPDFDPLIFWQTGGLGCSSLSALFYEIGPLQFDYENSRTTPTLVLNPYSWTKVANIIFIDAPAGTGFSYSTANEGYNVSDTLFVDQNYEFLRRWLIAHPKFLKNQLYIAGDSFTGLIAPKGTVDKWVRCNETMSYETNVVSSIEVQRNLTQTHYRALVYSGDHDMNVPHMSTHGWIKSLSLLITQDWTPWFVDGQVAGYSVVYYYENYRFTFATVKGAGHTAPEFKPEECFAMFDRWLARFPL